MEKIYAVEFVDYTNCCRTAVRCEETDEYLHIDPDLPFLIRESDIEKYRKFGKGYKSLELVGVLKEDQE